MYARETEHGSLALAEWLEDRQHVRALTSPTSQQPLAGVLLH
jgi:hypothetical protein